MVLLSFSNLGTGVRCFIDSELVVSRLFQVQARGEQHAQSSLWYLLHFDRSDIQSIGHLPLCLPNFYNLTIKLILSIFSNSHYPSLDHHLPLLEAIPTGPKRSGKREPANARSADLKERVETSSKGEQDERLSEHSKKNV
ncbi:hypothetical protein L1887_57408 [Cichorium endivia]|nr:hypothetical protein L1887_57408 [Cichorium endivia]